AGQQRSPPKAPAARISPRPAGGPVPAAYGPRRLTRRLAHTAYILHTAGSRMCQQPCGHRELKVVSIAVSERRAKEDLHTISIPSPRLVHRLCNLRVAVLGDLNERRLVTRWEGGETAIARRQGPIPRELSSR